MSPTDFDPTNVTGKYILDANGEPVEEPDLFKWAEWYETADRKLAQTTVGEATVSTIFLGLDMNPWRRDGKPPVLWETMVFGGGPFDRLTHRYASREAALRGHRTTCATVARGPA
jgi:hypothetical protein